MSSAKQVERSSTVGAKYAKGMRQSAEDNYNITPAIGSISKGPGKSATVQQTMSSSQGNTGSAYLQKTGPQSSLICAPNIGNNLGQGGLMANTVNFGA